MELSPTAYVVLGMLRHGPRSGYEIKSVVDRSTRFFWAASYGQIYPELRRLADAGLVKGESKPTGGRKRTVYSLTAAGRKALRAWLEQPPEVFELRDETMLKLFFSSAAGPGQALEVIEARRKLHERKAAELREIEPFAAAAPDPYPHLVLRCGLAWSEAAIEWCERAHEELSKAEQSTKSDGRRK